jgi:hypothetical protein
MSDLCPALGPEPGVLSKQSYRVVKVIRGCGEAGFHAVR